jgi:hypothetical protein
LMLSRRARHNFSCCHSLPFPHSFCDNIRALFLSFHFLFIMTALWQVCRAFKYGALRTCSTQSRALAVMPPPVIDDHSLTAYEQSVGNTRMIRLKGNYTIQFYLFIYMPPAFLPTCIQCTYTHTYMCIHNYIHIYTCVYIYIYIYVYVYVYAYILYVYTSLP